MNKTERCPECGSRYIGEGILSNATMAAKGRFWASSKVMADICSNCGLVIKLKVEKPERFYLDQK